MPDPRQAVKSGAPQPLANYDINIGGLVFAAGSSDFKSGVPEEARRHPTTTTTPTSSCRPASCWRNLKKTFEAAGSSLDNVVKAQVFLTDLNNFNGFDEVWKEYFKVPPRRARPSERPACW